MADQRLWHPFADMSRVRGHELVLERGEGVWVYDTEGKRYLDATAALWYCNVGHGRTRLADAAASQMRELAGYQTFADLANRPALELANRVCGLAELGGGAAFFTSGGSDSIETAVKMARRFWRLKGEPDRTLILAREGAYHGMHAYGTSLSGIEANAAGWGPLVHDVAHVGRHDLEGVERALAEHRGKVAAVIGEPVQGAGGVHPPMEGYWEAVQDLCREEGALLILDEVVTGFARMGTWFGKDRYRIEPDLIIVAKGLSSGYAPIGAVLAAQRVVGTLWAEDAGPFLHGYTYSGHPAACAVALENLAIIEEEDLVGHVAGLEPRFAELIGSLAEGENVAEVRTAGLLAAIELSEELLEAGGLAVALSEARERGILTRGLVGRSIHVSPPLVIGESEVKLLADGLRDSISAAAAEAGK